MMRKAGLSKAALQGQGETVTVVAFPARDGTKFPWVSTITFPTATSSSSPRQQAEAHARKRQQGDRRGTVMRARSARCASALADGAGSRARAPRTGRPSRSQRHLGHGQRRDRLSSSRKNAGGSICMAGCPPAPRCRWRAGAASVVRPIGRSYKPDFVAKVKDLEKRQVEMDPVLRCRRPACPASAHRTRSCSARVDRVPV